MSSNTYVTNIDLALAGKFQHDLTEQGFSFTHPAHTLFCAKKTGVSCTLYLSGKLVVQGAKKDEFIEFYLEPIFLKDFSYTYGDLNVDTNKRIGIDESGKGDFFGPLCIAGVCAGGDEIKLLQEIGVKDSKKMTDKMILALARKIRESVPHYIVKINPKKYNELYDKFNNLNRLLAWGHATAIESLVKKTNCKNVIIDQFASEDVVASALERKNLQVKLTQRHRGEEDVVVAAASMLAREAFLYGLKQLGEKFAIDLPKGANSGVIQIGRQFVGKHGREVLGEVCKLHFKTLDAIIT